MAYSATVSKRQYSSDQKRYLEVTITETDTAATSEWSITDFPFKAATLVKYQATLTAGDGSTINPKLGYTTGWTANTQNDIGTNSTTAAHINDESTAIILNAITIFGVSQVDSGTNNTVSTVMLFAEGVRAL